MTTGALGPAEATSIAPLQLPVLAVVGEARRVGGAASVGKGSGVGLGIGVGGTGVLVGTAAMVMAIIVLAAATAEAWICAGSTVGEAGAQALKRMAARTVASKTRLIFSFSILNKSSNSGRIHAEPVRSSFSIISRADSQMAQKKRAHGARFGSRSEPWA